jgi:hypothetical protein
MRSSKKITLVKAALALLPFTCWLACTSSGTSDPYGGCQTNGQCTGNTVCVDGNCVAPTSSGGGSTSASSVTSTTATVTATSSTTGSAGGSCAMNSQTCTSDTDCCENPDALCENFQGIGDLCAPTCTVDSDCVTNCCSTDTANRQTCAPANFCCPSGGCLGGAGTACTEQLQCCQDDPNGDVCVGSPINLCAAKCTTSSQCEANCCVSLQGGGGACLGGAGYTCLP